MRLKEAYIKIINEESSFVSNFLTDKQVNDIIFRNKIFNYKNIGKKYLIKIYSINKCCGLFIVKFSFYNNLGFGFPFFKDNGYLIQFWDFNVILNKEGNITETNFIIRKDLIGVMYEINRFIKGDIFEIINKK